jgi:site-specific DNA recombinase
LVPVIFDRYANRKTGSSALAAWLNENGHRTKNGRLWSSASVITVLRNRTYLGEIYYRGNWYAAPHQPLIPEDLFGRAQALLEQRNEDRSKRRSNPTEYLLSGRIRCGRCGQAYVGTAAHGRNNRYSYYTCFTRMRYGGGRCDNDRLPADQLEQVVTRRLSSILEDHRLIDRAISQAYAKLTERDEQQESELAAVQGKLAETRAAMDRYFHAFETATMPEETCAPRIAALSEQANALQARAAELATRQDEPSPERASTADLDKLRRALQAALKTSTPTRIKPILQALIENIRVEDRENIQPTFRIPAVRVDSDYMEPAGIEPATSCLQRRPGAGWMVSVGLKSP